MQLLPVREADCEQLKEEVNGESDRETHSGNMLRKAPEEEVDKKLTLVNEDSFRQRERAKALGPKRVGLLEMQQVTR